jgi:hypothetical protein
MKKQVKTESLTQPNTTNRDPVKFKKSEKHKASVKKEEISFFLNLLKQRDMGCAL